MKTLHKLFDWIKAKFRLKHFLKMLWNQILFSHSLSASFILVISFPTIDVLTTYLWYLADPRGFFVDKLLAYSWGSPLRCFSKLFFLTDPIPSIQVLLNSFMFFILLSNWIQFYILFLQLFSIQYLFTFQFFFTVYYCL